MDNHEAESRKRAHLTKGYKKYATKKPNWNKEALLVWSLVVRLRAGCCELCFKEGEDDKFGRPVKGLDSHHICNKDNHLHRYSVNNGMALCKGCHKFNKTHSPHRSYNSVMGFTDRFKTDSIFIHRYGYWLQEGRKEYDKSIPLEVTPEEHYHKLLDVFISLLDGESSFPEEIY